ncbi:MAG: serine hydrolase domain-containing protein [Gemmatimonadota bacterium]
MGAAVRAGACLAIGIAAASCAAGPADCSGRELAVCIEEAGFEGTAYLEQGSEVLLWQRFGDSVAVRAGSEARYRIGSLTKSFTAALVLRLEEQGKLGLSDPLSRWIPGFAQGDSIRLHHLLHHQAGIRPFTKDDFDSLRARSLTLEEVVEILRGRALRFRPGTDVEYSDPGYLVLGRVVELATGRAWEEVLRSELTGPLGLTSVAFAEWDADVPDLAPGRNAAGSPVTPVDYSFVRSSGGLVASASDVARWTRLLLGGDVLGETATHQLMTADRNEFGYGWVVTQRLGRPVLFHNGQVSGFFAFTGHFPDDAVTVVLLSNRERPTGALAAGLARAMMGAKP